MNIDQITIGIGIIAVLITLTFRIIKLGKDFTQKIHLFTTLGYIIFSYTSAIVLVKMINLSILTYSNKLTLEIIQQNNVYVFMTWILIGLSAIISYISLLIEEKNKK